MNKWTKHISIAKVLLERRVRVREPQEKGRLQYAAAPPNAEQPAQHSTCNWKQISFNKFPAQPVVPQQTVVVYEMLR